MPLVRQETRPLSSPTSAGGKASAGAAKQRRDGGGRSVGGERGVPPRGRRSRRAESARVGQRGRLLKQTGAAHRDEQRVEHQGLDQREAEDEREADVGRRPG